VRGFIAAYERLKFAQDNPPSAEDLKKIENERVEEERARKIRQLRKSVA